jgi:Fe-S cluster biogenesis protein NfuA
VEEKDTPAGSIEDRIKTILENEIRPAVAMDGGDVVFAGFPDGVVEVVLQGCCAGCPRSTATLRFGIEARLRDEIPEVTRVVQV